MKTKEAMRAAVEALTKFTDCNFTYIGSRVFGTDARLTREDVEQARSALSLLRSALEEGEEPVPSNESAVRLPLYQAAQWNTAAACAASDPHKPVVLEGRTVLAVHKVLTASPTANKEPV